MSFYSLKGAFVDEDMKKSTSKVVVDVVDGQLQAKLENLSVAEEEEVDEEEEEETPPGDLVVSSVAVEDAEIETIESSSPSKSPKKIITLESLLTPIGTVPEGSVLDLPKPL